MLPPVSIVAAVKSARQRDGARQGVGHIEEHIGQRIRDDRERQQVGLRELARRLGISPSAISQIETGKSQPSVSTLYAIVTELGMSLDELFSGATASRTGHRGRPTAEGPSRTERERPASIDTEDGPVQRAASRRAIRLESGVRWEQLTRYSDPRADFLYVVYDAGGSSSGDDTFIRHEGREYGLVLSGTLEVTVGFDRYMLEPGDAICFDSSIPHSLRNAGDEPVHGVWFVIGRKSDLRTDRVVGDAR